MEARPKIKDFEIESNSTAFGKQYEDRKLRRAFEFWSIKAEQQIKELEGQIIESGKVPYTHQTIDLFDEQEKQIKELEELIFMMSFHVPHNNSQWEKIESLTPIRRTIKQALK